MFFLGLLYGVWSFPPYGGDGYPAYLERELVEA